MPLGCLIRTHSGTNMLMAAQLYTKSNCFSSLWAWIWCLIQFETLRSAFAPNCDKPTDTDNCFMTLLVATYGTTVARLVECLSPNGKVVGWIQRTLTSDKTPNPQTAASGLSTLHGSSHVWIGECDYSVKHYERLKAVGKRYISEIHFLFIMHFIKCLHISSQQC